MVKFFSQCICACASACADACCRLHEKSAGIAGPKALTGTLVKSASPSPCIANLVHIAIAEQPVFLQNDDMYVTFWPTPTSSYRGEPSGVKYF